MSRRESVRPPLSDLATRLEVDIDPGLLERSVTHRSYAYENGNLPTNEQAANYSVNAVAVSYSYTF